jgi:hypothetical protein
LGGLLAMMSIMGKAGVASGILHPVRLGAIDGERRRARSSVTVKLVVFGVVIVLCLLRCIHLSADTPTGISTDEGLYIDEGYKTMAPRNLVLFGSSRAHAADQYPGWLKSSPLTNWPYYLAFKWFGVEIEYARLVTVAYFMIFLGLYVVAMAGRYGPGLLLGGLLALSVQHTLFFSSRVALLEVPIITLLYSGLFMLANMDDRRGVIRLGGLAAVGLLCFYGVKKSALLYLFPLGLAATFSYLRNLGYFKNKKIIYGCVVVFIVLLLTVACLNYDIWWHRVGHSVLGFISRTLNYPLAEADGFLVLAGVLCGCHGLLCRPKAYLGDFYRASLLGLITLCPVFLAVFPYNPLRYYVPVVPAYILLILEWVRLGSWRDSVAKDGSWLSVCLAFGMLFLSVFYTGVLVNENLIKHLPVSLGDEPGLSGSSMVRFFGPVALVASLGIFLLRRRLFSGSLLAKLIGGIVVMGFVYNIGILSHFVTHPSYQSRQIQDELKMIVPDGAIVAGDWAPFLTINTNIRSLYMNKDFNRKTIGMIRPAFFLDNSNRISEENMEEIQNTAGASLGEAILKSQYHGAGIKLYPIFYSP